MHLSNRLLIVLIFVSLTAVVLLAIQNHNISKIIKHEKIPELGDKAYIFTSKDLNDQNVSIKSAKALLIFFNTTCESCNQTAELWQEFYEKNSLTDLRVVGISADPVGRIENFVSKHALKFPIIADSGGKILGKYRVTYFPLIVLINQTGKILLYQHYGQYMYHALKEAKKILNKIS